MRNLLIAVLILGCPLSWARTSGLKPGSQCGLTDLWGGEANDSQPQWIFHNAKTIALQDLKPSQILSLPTVTQQQLMAGAEGEGKINPIKAVEYFTTGSSGGEAYIHEFEFNGQVYDAILYYPGDNPYGVIFLSGQTAPFALNGDGDISCVN